MKTFRIERNATVVQFAYVEAESDRAARLMAEHDPQLIDWRESSLNDPVVVEVREVLK